MFPAGASLSRRAGLGLGCNAPGSAHDVLVDRTSASLADHVIRCCTPHGIVADWRWGEIGVKVVVQGSCMPANVIARAISPTSRCTRERHGGRLAAKSDADCCCLLLLLSHRLRPLQVDGIVCRQRGDDLGGGGGIMSS